MTQNIAYAAQITEYKIFIYSIYPHLDKVNQL